MNENLPPLAAAIQIADVGLADDGDGWLLVGILRVGGRRSGSSDDQESGEDELLGGKSETQQSEIQWEEYRRNVYQLHVELVGWVKQLMSRIGPCRLYIAAGKGREISEEERLWIRWPNYDATARLVIKPVWWQSSFVSGRALWGFYDFLFKFHYSHRVTPFGFARLLYSAFQCHSIYIASGPPPIRAPSFIDFGQGGSSDRNCGNNIAVSFNRLTDDQQSRLRHPITNFLWWNMM